MPPWVQRHINVLERRANWLEARIHIAADSTGKNLDWDKQELATNRFVVQLIRNSFGGEPLTQSLRTFQSRFAPGKGNR